MKILNRVLLLAMAFIFIIATVGCKSGKNDNGGSGSLDDNNPYPLADDLYKGIHKRTETKLSDYFMQNGTTTYKIVIPSNYSKLTLTAVAEIVDLFYDATDVVLEVVDDVGLTHLPDAKYISIGDTALASAVDVELKYSVLGESGYKIVTKDKSIFLLDAGQYGYGLVYAAYDLLYYLIGYEFYSDDVVVYEKELKNINLYNLDITEVPDFEWRVATYNPPNNNTASAHRYRVHRRTDNSFMLQAPNASISHTLQSMFTKGVDPDKWFGDDNIHMCFTAHGDQASLEAFVQATCDKVIGYLIENPHVSIFNLGQGDSATPSWCNCPACSAELEKYGTDAAVMIKWANRVAEKVEQELEANYGGRKFMLSTFAYQKTLNAPVKRQNGIPIKDESGNYIPVDESIKTRDNLAILLAINNGTFTKNLYEEENSEPYENLKMWSMLTDTLYTWIYSANFLDFLVPYNSFDAMQQTYSALKEFNSEWIHDQAQYSQNTPTGFSNLKLYLNSQLQWQVNQNYNKLLDKYFKNYFGNAAEPMRKYFEELRTHMIYLESNKSTNGYSGWIYFDGLANAKYWSQGTLERWQGYISQAMRSIENLKLTDSELYNTLSKHIRVEAMCIRYLDIMCYKRTGNFEVKQAFKTDCIELGINNWSESIGISELFSSWGI